METLELLVQLICISRLILDATGGVKNAISNLCIYIIFVFLITSRTHKIRREVAVFGVIEYS